MRKSSFRALLFKNQKLDATIPLFAIVRCVVGDWLRFTEAFGLQALGVYTVSFEPCHDRGHAEHENWVFGSVVWLEPKFTRVLLRLSRGGGDAEVVREYDVVTKAFVKDGFQLPEAKSFVAWKDLDTLYVGTDFGPGSLTSSGYPRVSKLWKRGTPLSAATQVFEGKDTDVGVGAGRSFHQGRTVDYVTRSITFFENETYILEADKPELIAKPNDAEVSFFQDFVLFQLRSAWTDAGSTWPAGSLLAAPLTAYRAGKHELQSVYTPAPNRSLESWSGTKNTLLLNVLEDVHSKVQVARYQQGHWVTQDVPVSGLDTVTASAYDDEQGDEGMDPVRRRGSTGATGVEVS